MATGGKGVFQLVGGIFAPIGLVLLGVAWFTGHRQYTILKSWPTVDAQVTESRVTRGRDSEGHSMYSVEIQFRYTVNGKDFVTPSSLGYSSSDYTEMKGKADKYASGSRHPIRYNPGDPNDIRFDVGYNFGFFFLPVLLGGMGLIFAGVGVGLLVAARSVRTLVCPSCGQPVEKVQSFCPNCAAALPTS